MHYNYAFFLAFAYVIFKNVNKKGFLTINAHSLLLHKYKWKHKNNTRKPFHAEVAFGKILEAKWKVSFVDIVLHLESYSIVRLEFERVRSIKCHITSNVKTFLYAPFILLFEGKHFKIIILYGKKYITCTYFRYNIEILYITDFWYACLLKMAFRPNLKNIYYSE